ncbi:uncharacterized protein MEPE_06737 [Melanopsichium pennsylvanicum]|uniref:MINDY deubiquitinase domain-containing protein n=2 Tax=Melanopsichium pennsylvanicum TaxID=63383 RepID=A0AAJ4XTV6_9BASI|nr:duf544-domain-containing protein [Melanopsichium pennsylvanicum 4]SNX88026.1 uncharacterized protein MEPE_06737 [Melanopsichium pennsylvanicum]
MADRGRVSGGGGGGFDEATSAPVNEHHPLHIPHSAHQLSNEYSPNRSQPTETSASLPPSSNLSAPTMATATSSKPSPSHQTGNGHLRIGQGHEEAQWSLKDIYWQGRECKIITQNQNGPCSLIALCNILLLRRELQITPPDRPVVSYSYLSGLLGEHLLIKTTSSGNEQGLEAALSTIPRTQYGLDVDVGFDSITSFAAAAGTGGGAGELALFSLCGVQLVHGWLPDPADIQTYSAVRAAGSYNRATDIVVKGDEVAQGAVVRDRGVGTLAAHLASQTSASNGKQPERQEWTDEQRATVRQALALQSFLDTQSTQLTYHGLFVLAQELPAGVPVALFRNSHLSVLYKRQAHEAVEEGITPPTLFTLATDSSFLMEDEIVWESLVDADGASSEFYDAKFRKSIMRQGDYVGIDADGIGAGADGVGLQNNEDADYALAMQIYQNDQDRLERQQQRRQSRRSASGTQPQSIRRSQQQHGTVSAGSGDAQQPAFEVPKEVFTTMRYEAEPTGEEGDALVVSSLIPSHLQEKHEDLIGGLQGLSVADSGAAPSANPSLMAADNVGGAVSLTNPFLANPSTTTHHLYRHIPLLQQHLERLKQSAGAICRAFSSVWSMPLLESEGCLEPLRILDAIASSLGPASPSEARQVKGIRVAIHKDGSIRVTHRNISPFPSTLEEGVARMPSVRLDYMPTRVRSMDLEPIVFNKTDAREFYEAAKQRVGADPSVLSGVREGDRKCFDVILWNDEQIDTLEGASSAPTRFITESSLANVIVELITPGGGRSRFVTPKTNIGMLDGLLRHWMVDKGLVEEQDVELDELVRRLREGSANIWLCNSLRGMWRVELVDAPQFGGATDAVPAKAKKTARFSSFIKSSSKTNSTAEPQVSAGPAPPVVEQVHESVADDLYGHKDKGKSGKKGKKGGKDKDCVIM